MLSAVGLAFNLLANGLLVLRFSATASHWHLATVISLLCWFLKVSIAAASICIARLILSVLQTSIAIVSCLPAPRIIDIDFTEKTNLVVCEYSKLSTMQKTLTPHISWGI